MRVRFLRDFDWSPAERKGQDTIAFKAGQELTVRRQAGEAAIAAGAAEEVKKDDDAGR
jgi:hypothetical protein